MELYGLLLVVLLHGSSFLRNAVFDPRGFGLPAGEPADKLKYLAAVIFDGDKSKVYMYHNQEKYQEFFPGNFAEHIYLIWTRTNFGRWWADLFIQKD
jgi:hypothetical protein